MLEKKYYQIRELKELFNVAVEDIRTLVINKKIELCFYLHSHNYICGEWIENKGFVGYCTMNYRGLVKIGQSDQLNLALKDNININACLLMDIDLLSNLNFDCPFVRIFPNDFLYDWQPQIIDRTKSISAKLFSLKPDRGLTLVSQMFIDTYESTNKNLQNQNQNDQEPKSEVIFKNNMREFSPESIKLTLEGSFVLRSELIRVGCIKPQVASETTQKSTVIDTKRPIDTLLKGMLSKLPNDKPSQIWEKLREDVLKDFRVFDIDEILDEVDNELLYWFDNKSEIKQMKKKSFYNLINKLKIN